MRGVKMMSRKLSVAVWSTVAGLALSAQAGFNAWVYEYGSNAPAAAQQAWEGVNLVDTSAGAANATFSGAYNNEKNCFDGKLNTRWIQNSRTSWVIYKFPSATRITSYALRQATNNGYDSRVPVSFELYGSNAESAPTTETDASWVNLDTRTGILHNFAKDTNYDFGSRVLWLQKTAEYRYYLLKVTANKSDGYTVLGQLEFYNQPFPADLKFKSDPVISRVNGSYQAAGSFLCRTDCEIKAVVSDGVTETVETVGSFTGSDENQTFAYAVPTTLNANTTYSVRFTSVQGERTVETSAASFYTGALTLTKTRDAAEEEKVPAELTISRASADPVALPVTIVLTEGTAKEGVNYQPMENPVVIPAGATSATFQVKPLVDTAVREDTTLTVSVGCGNTASEGVSVPVTVANRAIPADKNVWVSEGDTLASTASNWSLGRVPTASDDVLIAGSFSCVDLVWDGGENGLGDTVKSWTQEDEYTGTVTIKTRYPEAAGSNATALNIAGNLTIASGTWTHPANATEETFRIKVLAGGDVTIGAGVKITAKGKGFAVNQARPGSALGCHASPMGSAGNDKLYGSMKKPEALGSGNAKGAGGGAIYLEATGAFANDGILTAASTGGASGSIYVKAASVSGAGTYSVRTPESVGGGSYQAGSGGRIAFELTSATTITDNEEAFVNGKCAAGFSFNGRNAAAGGTVFVKSPTRANGVLYISGRSGPDYSYVRLQPEFKNMLAIPANESWTLDGLVFLNSPIAGLRVPAGTTLSLPGGLASVKAYGGGGGIGGSGGHIATGNRGLVVDGGDLILPTVAEHLIANNWTLQANKPYMLRGDVRVNAGGRLGVVSGYATTYAYTNRCDLTVTGNLTVESKGSVDATGAGWKNYNADAPVGLGFPTSRYNGAHGGVSKDHSNAASYAYDSILNPMLPGEGAQSGDAGTAEFGGGCVKLTVGGKLTLSGSANAKSPYQDHRAGSGGTINITCGSLEGAGTINVTSQTGYGGTQGGGGRVAIRLTDADADFTAYPLSRITVAQSGNQSSGGTVYLQTAAEGENGGTVYIKGDADNTATVMTPFPSLHGGGEADDFRSATLAITSNGKALLSADVKVKGFRMGTTGKLDLNGKMLKVKQALLTKSDGTALPKLAAGAYSAAQLNELTGTTVYADSSAGATGRVVVTGCFLLVVR